MRVPEGTDPVASHTVLSLATFSGGALATFSGAALAVVVGGVVTDDIDN